MSKQAPKTAATVRKLLNQISQAQIADFQRRQTEIATLKRALKAEEEGIKALEESYIDMLDKGYTCEEGDLRFVVDVTQRSATPKYKELYAAVAGPKAVEQAQIDAGVSTYKHIKVVVGKVLVP